MKHVIGYAYKKPGQPLRDAGATEVFIDVAGKRDQRAALMEHLGNALKVRQGDTVELVTYGLRNLSGGPTADAVWSRALAERGVTLRIVDEPARAPQRRGPKSDYVTTAEHWDIWHEPGLSDVDKLEQMSRDAGVTITRNVANRRYGTRAKPLPRPSATQAAE